MEVPVEDKTDGLDTVIYDLQLPFFSQNINATKCSTTGNQWLFLWFIATYMVLLHRQHK